MIVQSIIAAILVVIGVIILAGKGDMLIAGYNTASEEEKEKVNIKRLRLLIGGLSVIIAIFRADYYRHHRCTDHHRFGAGQHMGKEEIENEERLPG